MKKARSSDIASVITEALTCPSHAAAEEIIKKTLAKSLSDYITDPLEAAKFRLRHDIATERDIDVIDEYFINPNSN